MNPPVRHEDDTFESESFGPWNAASNHKEPPPHTNGSNKIVWAVACGLTSIYVVSFIGALAWGNSKLWELRDQNTAVQLDVTKQISVLTVEMTRAIGVAEQAVYRATIAERESRLAQEDLTMLRAAVRQHGIPADGAGDH